MVRIDQRGFGQSGPVAKDYPLTTALYLDDLTRVIQHVANGPVHVVDGKSGRTVFESWQKTIPSSELVIVPIDGYHAAGPEPRPAMVATTCRAAPL